MRDFKTGNADQLIRDVRRNYKLTTYSVVLCRNGFFREKFFQKIDSVYRLAKSLRREAIIYKVTSNVIYLEV